MSWIITTCVGIALVILAGGLVSWVNIYMEAKRDQMKDVRDPEGPDAGDLTRRLGEVEARLRDVLDVMIALSEKMDRWEREGVPTAGERASRIG